jgi:hypothetical protein
MTGIDIHADKMKEEINECNLKNRMCRLKGI